MKDIVFDFGNVIANFEPRQVYLDNTITESEADYIAKVLIDKDVWNRMDKGQSIDKLYIHTIKKIDPDHHQAIKEVLETWYTYLKINPKMEDLIIDLKDKGHRIYLLSNFSKQFKFIKKENKAFFKKFDGIYVSSDRGFIKPTYMAYLDFLKQNKLKAEDCIFIDDKIENLENPEELGFETYHFDGDVKKLREHLLEK